ncbi:hypothetical protein DFP72DRAFT_1008733 [Ephemerocybe angulata]|uniref:Nephrocystin 3-like N-terminal domain-containing protein n=1 Tax=Ephemerocybe angulata TaxID=980116 RepID=A0A8H6I0R9_9AGAR|nr:hypothetical protein DFP72DRAFT_1008733 [Tulosesus angulatus]
MDRVPPTHLAAPRFSHGGFRAPRSVPEASGSLDTGQGLASTSPEGTSPSLNVISNTSNYFVKSAKNVSMGPNHGTHSTDPVQGESKLTLKGCGPIGIINQDSGAGVVEEESHLTALDFLSKQMAAGAIHDSNERCDAPKCMPETRVAVQDEVFSWITDGQKGADPKRILWVTGPAGTGKTAIMGTIAERCKAKGMLAATFFFSSFSGSVDRRSKTFLVSTLAYQLLQNENLAQVGQFRTRMHQAIRHDPAILLKRLQTQLEELVIHPLLHGAPTGAGLMPQHRMAIIVDGIDECDYVVGNPSNRPRTKEDEQIEILSAILHAANDPSFPFVFVIASRPELAIREFFNTSLARSGTRELFLDDKYNPDTDILLFYEAKFSYIRRRFNLSPEWPSVEELLQLVAGASGQFVYATTVIRFVEGPAQNVVPVVQELRTPHQRLMRILERRTQADTPDIRPLEALDILYDTLVRTCSEPLLSMKWLRALSLLAGAGSSVSMPARLVRLWLEQSPGEEVCALGPLSSLIHIPSNPNCDELYTFYHKSFVDFFENRSRCRTLYVSPNQTCDFLSQKYFENMDSRRFFSRGSSHA